MKAVIIGIVIFLALLIFVFRGAVGHVVEDIIQPDLNPQLVSYLQGDWISDDSSSIYTIKRDSLVILRNDSTKNINILRYLFIQPASKYFTSDSAFNFTANGNNINDFKLIALNNKTPDTLILHYVSKSKIQMHAAGKPVTLMRKNN